MRARIWARRLVGLSITLAAVLFLGRHIVGGWQALQGFSWQPHAPLLVASVALQAGTLAFGVAVWRRVLRAFGTPAVPFGDLLSVWSLANLTRYIPGGIWQLVAGAELADRHRLPRWLLLASLAVHIGHTLVAALLVACCLLPLSPLGEAIASWLPACSSIWWLPLISLPLALLAVHPGLIRACLSLLSRLSRSELPRWRGTWWLSSGLLALMGANWLVSGLSFWLFLAALFALPASAWPGVSAVHALSFLAGYGVLFAPGGLGVREASMALLLQPYLPLSVAAALAGLARLWSVAAELATVALALSTRRRLDLPKEPTRAPGSLPPGPAPDQQGRRHYDEIE